MVGPALYKTKVDICIIDGGRQAAAPSRSRRRMGSHYAPRRRVWMLPPDGFRELRRGCLLSRKACADLLGCSLSCVRAWDCSTHRVALSEATSATR